MSENFWWLQTGPSQIFEDISSIIGIRPIIAVACPPRTPIGFIEKLWEQLSNAQFYRPIRLSWNNSGPTPSLLGSAIEALGKPEDIRTYRNLLPTLDKAVPVLDGIPTARAWEQVFRDLPDWVQAHKSCSSRDKPTLIVIVPENLVDEHGLQGFSKSDVTLVQYHDYVERIDMLSFVHETASYSDFLVPRFFETLIADFCGWDAALAAELVNWTSQQLMDPWDPMVDLATNAPDLDYSWSSGGAAPFLGNVVVSPLALAALGNRVNFDRALWHAQAAQIFPWIEYRRLDLCDHINTSLQWPVFDKNGVSINRAEDAEIGSLFFHYRQDRTGDPLVCEFLNAGGEARNNLAHQRPLTSEMLVRLQNSWRSIPDRYVRPVMTNDLA